MQDVFIGTNKGAVVRALPQVAQMIRKVSVDVAFCGSLPGKCILKLRTSTARLCVVDVPDQAQS